jgi:hypothetical protein
MKEHNQIPIKSAIAAQPTVSNRALARQLGISEATVRRYRIESATPEQLKLRTGIDGKLYKVRPKDVDVDHGLFKLNIEACTPMLEKDPTAKRRVVNTFKILINLFKSTPKTDQL